MTFVYYHGEVVATFGATRYYLSPALDHLDRKDPLVCFVAAMVVYGLAVRQGLVPGPFTSERAERFARHLMMDEWDFRAYDALGWEDERIARAAFGVPVEQVEKRRRDLRERI